MIQLDFYALIYLFKSYYMNIVFFLVLNVGY